jgi:NADH dehydrogenase FAD-containing subunit
VRATITSARTNGTTAPGLKKIDDATAIRRRILVAFEPAESCADDAERTALLTFVVSAPA